MSGAASEPGRSVAGQLVRTEEISKVIALDSSRGDLEDVVWRVSDVRDPSVAKRLSDVDVVVHAEPVTRDSRSTRPGTVVRGAQALITAATATGVRRVVLLSSAMVYGASPENPVPLNEDAALNAVADGAALTELLDLERLAATARKNHQNLEVTVVRPATLVGAGIEGVLNRYFNAPRLLVVKDGRPRWQFCHVEDLATAMALAATGRVTGDMTVGSEGSLDVEDVERITGLRRIELPAGLAFGTAERLNRLGVVSAPASELQYAVHPWVVPSTALQSAGWHPQHENEELLRQLLAQEKAQPHGRRRREATIGAAGATVAVIGTAALVRRARKRRLGGMP